MDEASGSSVGEEHFAWSSLSLSLIPLLLSRSRSLGAYMNFDQFIAQYLTLPYTHSLSLSLSFIVCAFLVSNHASVLPASAAFASALTPSALLHFE